MTIPDRGPFNRGSKELSDILSSQVRTAFPSQLGPTTGQARSVQRIIGSDINNVDRVQELKKRRARG